MLFWRLLSSSSAPFFYQFVQYMFKVVMRDLTCLIWVGFWNESCRYFQYLCREYLFANFDWIVWEIWICEDCCQFVVRIVGLVQNLFKVILRNLESRIWEGLPTKSCSLSQYRSNQYLFTFFRWVFCELWIFEVCCIAIWGQKQSRFVNCFRSIRFQNLIIFWIQKL
jgi:hypothetical protein